MSFQSILFLDEAGSLKNLVREAPACFVDLNLDQIINTVTQGKEDYELKPYFFTPLQSTDAIAYRHEIFRDFEESSTLRGAIDAFAANLRQMRETLKSREKLHYPEEKESYFLDAVLHYCRSLNSIAQQLDSATLRSRGLLAFRDYLKTYIASPDFASLLAEANKLESDLRGIRYNVLIKGLGFRVSTYDSRPDYSLDVESTFAKFRQGAVKSYLVKLPEYAGMNHIEAKVAEFVTRLHPELFGRLSKFCAERRNYLDEIIGRFDREVQFYCAYLDYKALFQKAALALCYPTISDTDKAIHSNQGFDLALAHKLIQENAKVVCNDFFLRAKERIFVVTGPNQGGKTTFARLFGQLHYLASLGCPVAGQQAKLFLCDQIFTHFEKEESVVNLRGKLEDDLIRMHAILEEVTSRSVVIMNEIFTSTTLHDAIFLGKRVLERLDRLDLLGVFVTFIDEFTILSEKIVSVASTIVPNNPALRTFKIIRKPADGLAYALAIAEKHRVTYQQLKERLAS